MQPKTTIFLLLFGFYASVTQLILYVNLPFILPINDSQEREDIKSFIITSDVAPVYANYDTTIANGYIGHRLHSDTIHKNGLYNGYLGESHRARIPSTIPYVNQYQITYKTKGRECETVAHQEYVLNMWNGSYADVFNIFCQNTRVATVTQLFYSHRNVAFNRIVVTELQILLIKEGILTVPLKNSSGAQSTDIDFVFDEIHVIDNDDGDPILSNVKYQHGVINTPETKTSEKVAVHILSTVFPTTIKQYNTGSQSYAFISAFEDTKESVYDYYRHSIEEYANGHLYSCHCEAWNDIWKDANIGIDTNNDTLVHSVLTAYYYLLSSVPPDGHEDADYDFYGISPGGLTNGGDGQDYWGHVFWDQDFWMLPALLPLYPEKVKYCLTYRVKKLGGALRKAAEFGYDGAFYPWESAFTGEDVCPGDVYIKYEQHVTADMIHMLKQYLYATNDWRFLDEVYDGHTAWEMIYETAKFWKSRVHQMNDGGYGINGVMGPDEYHSRVDNSAFTNAAAAQNLLFAVEVSQKLHKDIPELSEFEMIARSMYIPYNAKENYHPEFDGFNFHEDEVKQADTIMLNFPLNFLNNETQIVNDLKIYEEITDENGPAMTSGMFAINWLSLSEVEKAGESFEKQLQNVQKPFQVWTEISDGRGAVNFLTGIGGYLQSILYGYVGLRINKNTISLRPQLIPNEGTNSGYTINGMKYMGNVFSLTAQEEYCSVEIQLIATSYDGLLYTLPSGQTGKLIEGESISFEIQEIIILSVIDRN